MPVLEQLYEMLGLYILMVAEGWRVMPAAYNPDPKSFDEMAELIKQGIDQFSGMVKEISEERSK